MCFIGDILKDY